MDNNQQNNFENSNIQETENTLTTDDLVLMIGEREVNLFQNRKIVNKLKNKLTDLYKINQTLTFKLDQKKENKDLENLKEENKKLIKDHKIIIKKLNKKIENLRIQLKKEEEFENKEEIDDLDGENFEDIVELE
jgi:hypothetical protein